MKQKSIVTIVVILLLALGLAACNTAAAGTKVAPAGQIPEVVITTSDYAFEVPAQIEAGLVSMTLENEGQEPHHVQLARLNDDVSIEQFQTAMQQGPEAAFSMVSWTGGPAVVDAGGRQTVTVDLAAGTYMLLCFVPDQEGVPHIAHGMVASMEVVDNGNQVKVQPPRADGTLTMLDFSFVLPTNIKAGPQVWEVVNKGVQPHEINLVKLAHGKTMADIEAFMHAPQGTPPYEDVGGFQAIDGNKRGWLHLNLTTGDYVALCHVPDPDSGQAHTELGMIMPFSVK